MESAFYNSNYVFMYSRRDNVPEIPLETMTYIELTYCLEGEMEYFYNGEAATIRSGDAILYPVGAVRQRSFTDKPNYYVSFNLILDKPVELEVSGVIRNCVTPGIIYMFDTFKREFESASPFRQEKCASIFSYLYYQLLESQKDNENPYVRTAKQYINSHISEEITLEQLARETDLAPNYLCAVFKKNTGMTLMQYLIDERIELSKRLMLTRADELYNIARLSGFPDYNHFSHTFKRITGVTPAVYRKLKKGK